MRTMPPLPSPVLLDLHQQHWCKSEWLQRGSEVPLGKGTNEGLTCKTKRQSALLCKNDVCSLIVIDASKFLVSPQQLKRPNYATDCRDIKAALLQLTAMRNELVVPII